MEHKGFLVDRRALAAFGESLGGGIEKLQQDIWRQAGHEFNINSPKQLGEVLFEELMLPAGKKDQDRLEHQRRRPRKAHRQAPR